MSSAAQLTAAAAAAAAVATATTSVSNNNVASAHAMEQSQSTAAATSSTSIESNLIIIQDMIDLSANHLEGLRTQCATSATLTQQEIRSLESKLVRYFSELLLAKTRLNERIPANGLLPHSTGNELRQWLRVVGLGQESLNVCLARLSTLEQMLEQSDEQLRQLLSHNPSHRDEELRRLTKAMNNLRKCMESLDGSGGNSSDMEQWFWDSWDRSTHHHHVHRGSIGNIGLTNASPRADRHHRQHGQKPKASGRQSPSDELSSVQSSQLTLTQLTPSPPNSPFTPSSSGAGIGSLNGTPQRSRAAAGTPPPAKKHQTLLSHSATPTHQSAGEHEIVAPRSRLPTDPSPDSYSSASSDIFVDPLANSNVMLLVPCSPGVVPVGHVGMGHAIKHRFSKVIGFMSTCNLCQKQVFSRWLKCIDCKYLCHKSCAPHVPPSCGLPPEYVNEFRHIKEQVGYSTLPHTHNHNHHNTSTLAKSSPLVKKSTLGKPLQQHGDSSSPSSSCTSSTPSSPALFQLQLQQQQQNHQNHQHHHHHQQPLLGSYGSSAGGSSSSASALLATPSALCQHKMQQSQFNFPNVTITSSSSASCSAATSGGGGTQTLISNEPPVDSSPPNGNNNSSNNNSSSGGNNANGAEMGMNHMNSLIGSQMSTHSTASNATTASSVLVSTGGTSTFYPRKLSTAGVDKRTPFISEYTDTHKSNDSDKTVSLSGSASTDSDRTPVRLDSTEDGDSGQWRQNSISLKEWDIPYGDLRLLERIGQGRFGTVHRALWHGDVAVKVLNEDYLQDEHMLETFRNEVANFKKTRHENLVLFMGACMNPPYLAIVTSLCKGNTLYTYIHQRREKFAMNRTLLIAQQIAQGMGYLHARGIIHKDLRTKNIFIENGKVIITDFGLFSSTKLLYCDMGLGVPHNWLCYLAPELIRALMPRKPTGECLEFTPYSDVYSFGTVWYELICGEFTFKDQPAESVIWQVGRGMKQSLANLQSGRDVKDLLMLCWTYEKEHRPEFARLLLLLEHLPKKRLARSPSHPVNLSRSAESVF